LNALSKQKRLTLVLRLRVKKAPSSVFESVKISVEHLALSFRDFFLNMKWVQNATIRSPIGAPEAVWHDVKHVIFF